MEDDGQDEEKVGHHGSIMSVANLIHYIRPALERDQLKLSQHSHGYVVPVLQTDTRVVPNHALVRGRASE